MEVRHHYLESINTIDRDVLKMGTLVEEAIRKAMQALRNRDLDLARRIVSEDKVIDRLELEIQDSCIAVIATEQPVARDLRGLVTVIRIIAELERMGDHAMHLAKCALRIGVGERMATPAELVSMAERAGAMIHQVLTAFMNTDSEEAAAVGAMDDDIDAWYDQLLAQCTTRMTEVPASVPQAIEYLFAARFLERLGDHATNIGEWICYNGTAEHRELNP